MNIETYVVTIKPESAFGTPLKGDTLFGQLCWQIAEDSSLADKGLDDLLKRYSDSPFAVLSSAWPVLLEAGKWMFALPRPELPPSFLGDPEGIKSCADRLKARKDNKARKWFMVPESLIRPLSWEYVKSDSELFQLLVENLSEVERKRLNLSLEQKPIKYVEQQHNTINRSTMTTGKGMFAPYAMQNTWYMPGMELAIFVALDRELISIEQIEKGLERVGQFGFGRDASTGLGKFSLGEIEEIEWPQCQPGQSVFSLSPCVPERNRFGDIYFQPFIRFGKHGAQLLHTGRPFKNPVVMADEGAVFSPKKDDTIDKPWVGRAVSGVSKALEASVVQGYSLALPLTLA